MYTFKNHNCLALKKENKTLVQLILHEKKCKLREQNMQILNFPWDTTSTWKLYRPFLHPSSLPYLRSPLAYTDLSANLKEMPAIGR